MNNLAKLCTRLLRSNLSFQKSGCRQYSEITSVEERNIQTTDDFSNEDELSAIRPREWKFECGYTKPREIWVENFDTVEEQKLGIIKLHPKVFATIPRLDIIHQNVVWQTLYRRVDKTVAKSRAECRGGGRKPWPQKGLGKARQGSIRAPHFIHGGIAHGPRNPTSYFYMPSIHTRVSGLTSTLSAKFAQDDIHVVNNIHIPSKDPEFLLNLIEKRTWGISVLIVDKSDIMPRNIVEATRSLGHVNLMPVYGLNVYSMLKHETLVLTVDAVNEIEDRLLTIMNTARDQVLKRLKHTDFGISYS
ncbi:UNVERIFIED_CONTAM: hypothetical protein PYX00_009723 [Menopon gallinae]|uniref:Large ribosomal subunit protein uL4m n=1 Tax=Menopon gallinae TaxID=328185 RepID=A0AAW2HC13_9NEOP